MLLTVGHAGSAGGSAAPGIRGRAVGAARAVHAAGRTAVHVAGRTAVHAASGMIAGIIAVIANILLEFFGNRETFWDGLLKGSTIGLGLCSLIMALLYITGKLSKVSAFKKSILKK